MTLSERIERTRSLCGNALSAGPLAQAEACLARAGFSNSDYAAMLRSGARYHRPAPELVRLRDECLAAGLPAAEFFFERALLIRTALAALDEVPLLPVDESVQHLFCREFDFYAQPPASALSRFALEGQIFPAMSGLVSLTRFPAGQYQWVISGLPRSWLPKIPPLQLARVCWFLATGMRGLAPYFVPHINATSMTASFLTEREYYKSFCRMATALEKQPAIRGIMAGAWMFSKETHRVSPHLAFFNKPYLESGGLYVDRGPAAPADGFLAGDPVRAARYHSGEYRPTFGLVFCTRDQAISWKQRHPELESQLAVR